MESNNKKGNSKRKVVKKEQKEIVPKNTVIKDVPEEVKKEYVEEKPALQENKTFHNLEEDFIKFSNLQKEVIKPAHWKNMTIPFEEECRYECPKCGYKQRARETYNDGYARCLSCDANYKVVDE